MDTSQIDLATNFQEIQETGEHVKGHQGMQ